ncbi:Cysteine proteinase RD21A-like protein [Drosera capensis]
MGNQLRNQCHWLPLLLLLLLSTLACLSWALSSEYSITGYDPKDLASDERIAQLFQQWSQKHGKVYRHAKEAARRRENFKWNLQYVIEKNSKRNAATDHTVGLNRFADLSNQEFKEMYLSKVKKPAYKNMNRTRIMRQGRLRSCDAPSSLDWRKKGVVTGVKDQGDCGSCWAFSSTGAIEGINAITTGDLVSLSEQELVSCDSTNYGCEGGYMDYAFEWVISNGGIDTESDYPYTGEDGTCDTSKEETKVVSINGYEDIDQSDSALLCGTVTQPISVGIDGSAIDFQLYTGGIYDGDCSSDPDDIDHAVLIVGYGSEGDEDYWIVKNSWGTSWGIQGYFYLKRNTDLEYGVCAVNAMASYPTKTSSSPSPYPSPAVPPPPPPTPPPPPPESPPPPPPPSPSPTQCGDFSYCSSTETCCCIFEVFDFCLIYGCCEYTDAVCCTGTDYCCPNDYPICDVDDGLCLKSSTDYLGIAAKKRKCAKYKFPWTKIQGDEKNINRYQPLQWRRNRLVAVQ